jgi:GNAT superfamily N-acetyltransferase
MAYAYEEVYATRVFHSLLLLCLVISFSYIFNSLTYGFVLKIEYRLRTAGNICFGFFLSINPDEAKSKDFWVESMDTAEPVETGRDDRLVLVAHILCTLGNQPVVTDEDMDYPRDWRELSNRGKAPVGHQQSGRTACLHSFSVLPKVQGTGVGKVLMRHCLQVLRDSSVVDRVALLCQNVSRLTILALPRMVAMVAPDFASQLPTLFPHP